MVFVDRKAKYPGRWTMKKSDGTSEVVILVRNDEPEIEGTPMNAETLNTLSDVAGADIARQQAEAAREAAAGSAAAAANSASAAEKSKTAAATFESNAAKHEKAAKKASEEAGAKAGTDKTLSIENAPADAKATGDALAGKLDLTGGAMTGDLDFGMSEAGIKYSVPNGTEYLFRPYAADNLLQLVIRNTKENIDWYGALNFNPDYSVTVEGRLSGAKTAVNLLYGIIASGSNYVRFGDGTQICWAAFTQLIGSSGKTYWTYPVAFASNPAVVFQSYGNDATLFDVVGGAEATATQAYFFSWRNNANEFAAYGVAAIAIGRWK